MGHCGWALSDERNRKYHDTEWGVPVHDDRQMFEHLTLECLQCGLSWSLMMKKREIFRRCFENFDCEKIAAYGEEDVRRILIIALRNGLSRLSVNSALQSVDPHSQA